MNVLERMSNTYFFEVCSGISEHTSVVLLKVNLSCCFLKALLCVPSIVNSTRAVYNHIHLLTGVMYPLG